MINFLIGFLTYYDMLFENLVIKVLLKMTQTNPDPKKSLPIKVFLSIKYYSDQTNRGRIENILAILEKLGAKTSCVVRDLEDWGKIKFSPQDLMRLTLQEIRNTHLVLVDQTEKGVGTGIEAGYAIARGIPVIVIAQHGCEISATMQGIACSAYQYQDWKDLEFFFQHLSLSEHV
jgi:2'-deoxynucleoside 5'-phosphate N-hydrolase